MNLEDPKYRQFSICKEMLETCDVIRNFDKNVVNPYLDDIRKKKKLFITGEGSSKIFPASHLIYQNLKAKSKFNIVTEGATQALEYDLSDFAVFGSSNSGKTKELLELFTRLNEEKHPALFGITANTDTPLEKVSKACTILSCGQEKAVAATKSVIEQVLFLDILWLTLNNKPIPDLQKFASQMEQVLTMKIDDRIINTVSHASKVYLAGRNNGVTEELALKTNEITHKKSQFLPGTLAVHGIEEVMSKEETLIIIDPFESEEKKFKQALADNVGMKVFAISTHQTLFPTIFIPEGGYFHNYLELAAGWNLLVEVGIHLDVNLDKGLRARKIGNEFKDTLN